MKKVRFATIGTSAITELFLKGAVLEPRFEYAGAYSRDAGNALRFAREHGAGRHFSSLEELAACEDVDAVYVASPNSLHFGHTMAMLEGGKHVLCEKAFASNARQVDVMCRTARERGLALMEAMKTTHSPYVRPCGGKPAEDRASEALFRFVLPVFVALRPFQERRCSQCFPCGVF